MTWRPLERVPDPLQLALCDAVRANILQRDVGRGIGRGPDGGLVVPIDDGTEVRVNLRALSSSEVRFGPRQAIRYEFDGNAVWGKTGYALSANATLDVRSKAFVDVACDILWQKTEHD